MTSSKVNFTNPRYEGFTYSTFFLMTDLLPQIHTWEGEGLRHSIDTSSYWSVFHLGVDLFLEDVRRKKTSYSPNVESYSLSYTTILPLVPFKLSFSMKIW